MHVHTLKISNFRRLRDAVIDLESDISIFVGANNSGKTSAARAVQLFADATKEKMSVHDFSSSCWAQINAFGEQQADVALPKISLDIWFDVQAPDLHRAIDLLPSLNWQGNLVGIRVEFAATDETKLLQSYKDAKAKAISGAPNDATYVPSPSTLMQYLESSLRREFEFKYYVLDHRKFNASFESETGYQPAPLVADQGRTGKDILGSLVKVSFLSAQRNLTDDTGGNRAEELSRCLSRFYERNLAKRESDFEVLAALSTSEGMLDEHLKKVFEPLLSRLTIIGYPGTSNPRLLIKSTLNPATIMAAHDGAKIHYMLEESSTERPQTLPDRYSGLGFKNLIYMVIELLDLQTRWQDMEQGRAPLHLIFIEEPEAHLHAQLQQVFVRQVLDVLKIEDDDARFSTQIAITTHSPHILYERGFKPIRYFRRLSESGQTCKVQNLSRFYALAPAPVRDFLERYLKLTHCDLFFADAAVLVEGNVERLILPQLIEKCAPQLQTKYLSVLEIGGAFGHRFELLIKFLGITTLVITDIDSVYGAPTIPAPKPAPSALSTDNPNATTPPEATASTKVNTPQPDASEAITEDDEELHSGRTCKVHEPNAVTSNQALIKWIPRMSSIQELLTATDAQKTVEPSSALEPSIRVAYQIPTRVESAGQAEELAGRTLEEAFALENIAYCQLPENVALGLRLRRADTFPPSVLATKFHARVSGSSFNKTDFALALLERADEAWLVPTYIADGLRWLEQKVKPYSGDEKIEIRAAV